MKMSEDQSDEDQNREETTHFEQMISGRLWNKSSNPQEYMTKSVENNVENIKDIDDSVISEIYEQVINEGKQNNQSSSLEDLRGKYTAFFDDSSDHDSPYNIRLINTLIQNILKHQETDLETIERPRFAAVFNIQTKFIQQTHIEDNYSEYVGHIAKDMEPVLNFLLYTRAHGSNINDIYDIVNNDTKLQELLGFDSFPSKPTFYTAKKDRFELTESDFSTLAEQYAYTAIRAGYEIPRDVEQWLMFRRGEIEVENQTPSIETKIKSIREFLRKEEFSDALACVELNRSHNTSYDVEEFISFLAKLARNSWSGSSGSKHAAYELDVDVPRVQTLNNHIKKFDIPDPDQFQRQSPDDIKLLQMFQQANDRIFRASLSADAIEANAVAIDTTNWRWYGNESPWNIGVEPKRNTATAWQFISISIVDTNTNFVIGTLPVDKKKNLSELSESLIQRVQKYSDPQYVYFDKEFYRSSVVKSCRKMGVNYLIQAKKSTASTELEEIVRKSDEKAKANRQFGFADMEQPPDLISIQQKKHRTGNKKEDIVSSYITDLGNYDGKSTNLRYDFDVDLKDLHSNFDDRWSIEAAFDSIKNRFLAPTSSPSSEVRIFYLLTSVTLYNAYQLSKIYLETSDDVIEGEIKHSALDFLTAIVEEYLEEQ